MIPREVLISITGTQTIGKDKDKIELITNGTIDRINGEYVIDYTEKLEDSPGTTYTTIRAGESKVTITRTGARNSQLLLEKGQRHLNHYDTGYGQLILGINTSKLINNLDKNGELTADYSIEMNHELASMNSFHLKIKEITKNDTGSTVNN